MPQVRKVYTDKTKTTQFYPETHTDAVYDDNSTTLSTILLNKQNVTSIVNHGASDTTFTLTPNIMHIWGVVQSLTLTLAEPANANIVNEYMFIFKTGSTPTTLTLPNTLLWDEGIDLSDWTPKPNTTYEVHIMNNIVRIGGAVRYRNDNYLNFTAVQDSTISMTSTLDTFPDLHYSTDLITWNDFESNTTVSLSAGDIVYFKGTNDAFCLDDVESTYTSRFVMTGSIDAHGNIMSLLYGDNASGETVLTTEYAFSELFSDCASLNTAPELPATELAYNCYNYMFNNCTSLTTVPVLPATTLANRCYSYMFSHCTSLTTAPVLPATTLANNCYYSMFEGCTGLTTAPELPATTLASNCYERMFNSCTNLTTPPELPATTLAYACYNYMFNNCTSLTSAPELPATTLATGCYGGMFENCTNLTTPPELPATTLYNMCYFGMFQSCTNLITAPELPATTLANDCYKNMFSGCTSLNYIKALFTTTPGTSYTKNWVNGVAATGTFVKNSAATWNVTGVDGIPSGWTVETASA